MHGSRGTGTVSYLPLYRDCRIEDENEKSQRDEREHAKHYALWHVASWVNRLFCGEW
jgi:hypothetical protein